MPQTRFDNATIPQRHVVDYERLFLDNLGLIERVVQGVARRHRLNEDERAELLSAVHLKIIEHDYGVLRKFECRCPLSAYLRAVVVRLFLDRRNAAWGKWRPSVAARRRGPLAIELERLLTRDGKSFDEAVAMLRSRADLAQTDDELYGISLEFPVRDRRKFTEEGAAEEVADNQSADVAVEQGERTKLARAAANALRIALNTLTPQNRLILKMRYCDRLELAAIARLLDMAQKPFYVRVMRVYDTLRHEMEKQGIAAEHVRMIVGTDEFDAGPLI